MINLGIYSINEVRELEDKDKIKNGDKHYMSLNYIDIDLMNEYQKQKVKIKDQENGDKLPENNQDNPNENIDDEKSEGGGNDGEENQGD